MMTYKHCQAENNWFCILKGVWCLDLMKRSWEGPRLTAGDSFDEEPVFRVVPLPNIGSVSKTYKRAYKKNGGRIGVSDDKSSTTKEQHEEKNFKEPSSSHCDSESRLECSQCEGRKKRCGYQSCKNLLCRCKTHGSCEECGVWDECSDCGKDSENGIQCSHCSKWIHWWCLKMKSCLKYPSHRFCSGCAGYCETCKSKVCLYCGCSHCEGIRL